MEVVLLDRSHQLEASSTSSSYSKEGFGIPYFAGDIRDDDDDERVIHHIIHAFTEQKKRFFIKYNKIHRYSIRLRGRRTSPFASLARKLGRFKVRSVIVQDPPNHSH